MIKIKDLKETIIKTNAELEQDKWIDKYDNYDDLMLKQEKQIKKVCNDICWSLIRNYKIWR